jgi:hypothetical protein
MAGRDFSNELFPTSAPSLGRDFSAELFAEEDRKKKQLPQSEPILSPEELMMGSIGAPNTEPSPVTPKKEVAFGQEVVKGAKGAVEYALPSMGRQLALQGSASAMVSRKKSLELMGKIDSGVYPSLDALKKDPVYEEMRKEGQNLSLVNSYYGNRNAPDVTAKMRGTTEKEFQAMATDTRTHLDMLNKYAKENKEKYGPRVEKFTDINWTDPAVVADFTNWLGYNMGSGAVQMAPIMLAAVVTKQPGLLAASSTMGVSEAVGNRLKFIQDQTKSLPPDQQGAAIAKYIADTGDASLITGLVSGSFDLILGPAAKAAKTQLSKSVGRVANIKEAVKELPKDIAGEAVTGSLQEATQIAAKKYLQEQGLPVTLENIQDVINAGAAEAAGAPVGTAVNVGMAALQRPPAPVTAPRQEPSFTETPAPATPEPVGRAEPSFTEAPITPPPDLGGRVEPQFEGAPAPAPAAVPPPAITPSKVEAVPGMMTDEDLAQPENLTITPVTVTEPEVTPVTPVLAETPAKAKWLKAINDQNRLQPEGGVQLTVTPEGKLNFMGDPSVTKQGRALEATLNEAIKAGATVEEIAASINSAKQPAPPVTPVTPIKPTIAAASLPETPTVPPAQTPKLFEPAPEQHVLAGQPIIEVPLKDIQQSKDLPQFKSGADAKGVVDRLEGKFDRRGVGAIQLWKRLDGRLEVISGRHRLDLAERSGETTIPAQINYESQGFDLDKATTLDSELNIRDDQGKVKDYVNYFKGSKITREEAVGKGLLARTLGKRSFGIATQGSEELIAAIRGDRIGDEAAYNITINAPNDARLQSVGLQAIMDGKSMQTATNTMQAVKAMAAERDTTTDMFGFDDSLIKEAQEMAKIAAKMQQSIAARLSAITGAAKNPAMAKAEGIDVRDPEAIKRRIEELRAQKAALENWSTSPELVAEIRAARGVEAPQLELRGETEAEIRAREATQDADRQAQEAKDIADRERDFFQLQPQVAEREEAPTIDMFGAADMAQQPARTAPTAPPITEGLFAPMGQRMVNAADRFRDAAVEQFGLTPEQADLAMGALLKAKVLTLNPSDGQFKLKDGRFWDREVLLKAAEGVEAKPSKPLSKEMQQAKELMLAEEDMYFTDDAQELQGSLKDKNWVAYAGRPVYTKRGRGVMARSELTDVQDLERIDTQEELDAALEQDKRIGFLEADKAPAREEAKPEAKAAAELTTSEREAEIKKINAGIKRLALEQIKLPVEDEVREAEIDKEMSVLIDRLKELQGKPKQARPAVVEKAPVFSETELTDMQNELVKLQQRKSVMIGDTSFIDNEIEDIKDALREAGIDPREFAIEANEAQGEDIVNDEQAPDNLPSNQRLLLMPCSDMKGPAKATAMELYKGVFFQTYKSNVQPGAFPLVVILSAKHGFINTNQEIAPYDEVMSTARADTMLANLPKYIANIKIPSGITDVMIVGGKEYQRVMRAAVAELQSFGLVSPEASINATSGGIGVQRQQLGEYLRAMQPTVPVITQEPFTIDVEAKVIDENVKRLPAPDVQKLEKHYGVKRGTDDFVQMVKDDIVRFANEGAEAVAKAIREIIRKLHAGVLSAAMIFNPVNISSPEFLFHPSQTYREDKQVLAEVPEDALPRMSPSARQAYKVLYPSIKDRLIKNDKLMVIADKPAARVFVFKPDGSLLLDKKVLYGSAIGDFYKGNNDLPQNRITPAGLFTLGLRDATRSAGEARTAGEYDFKKVFVLDKAIGGEYSVTLMHSVWLNESDAQARAKALLTPDAADSRYSFGCINVDKPTYSFLINNHLQQMDGASLFVVPDDPANLAAMLAGKENVGDELNRTTFKTPTVEIKKTGQLPSAKAREATQLAAGERRKKPSDFLFNFEQEKAEEEKEQRLFERNELRKEQIKEYATMRAALARVPKQVAAGEVDLSVQQAVSRLMQQARDLSSMIKVTKPRLDSAEQFLAKAAIEFDKGNISEDVFNVIKTAYDKMPELLGGLLLSVRAPTGSRRGRAAGQFLPFTRVVRLFKGTSGVTDPVTIRHELTHSLEQMMTTEQRAVVAQAWLKGLQAAIKKNPDEKHQKYFHAVMDFIDRPTEANDSKARDLLPSYDMYQFINPSEFWAVNAENLMAAELGNAWGKFKRAIARLWEGLKNVFGFDNRYVVQKMFKDVMNGSKERISKEMLVDLVGSAGVQFNAFENIEDDKKLLEKYNRPNTPQLDQSPLKTQVVNAGKLSKDFFTYAVSDPLEALGATANSVDRAMMFARIKNIFFGAGLNAADFAKYKGQLVTSEGLATSSVALDNAIRGGQIAAEVIFQGGIKFDSKSRNFVAVKRNKGMAGVYEAEIALKKRLGDQLGTDIIQGYLEAKRSRSIQNEYFDREVEYEFFKSNYEELLASGAPQEDIMAARDAMAEAKKDLQAIEVVYKKIRMSDEEIDEFIARDAVHPELRKIMDNWTAINQNMLAFWRQVGLLSEKRYENLSNIKDYVPWQRIMDDETDIHSPVQTSNRKMTNIGLEKLFKKGKPTVITDFVAKDGQQDFKIQPATEVEVEINGSPVDSDKFTMTADGRVKLDVPVTAGDLVVFKASREIENIIDNMTRNVMRMTMNGLRQAAAQRIVMEYATRTKNGKIMVFPKADKGRGRFDFIVNGKRVIVEIQDPLIAESIFGMESLDIAMLKPLAAVANFTRRTITLSGVFQIKQVFKDAPTAALVTGVKHPLLLIGGVYKGFVTSLLNTDPTVQILKSAGIGGFQSSARTPEAEIKRRLGIMNRNVFDFVIKGLDHIGDASDMAQRVATYKRVLAETGNETQALYQAANVINFLHHGSGQAAQFIVKTVPFVGAYANSIDVLVQALTTGGLKGMSRKKALARLAVTGTLLVGITLLYCMLVGDDDDYNQMDDQTKLRNFMIPGTKILLPINTSAAYFFKAVPELIYNKVMKEGTKNSMDWSRLSEANYKAAIDMLLGPTPVPSAIKPFVEIGLNKDFFTGRPIVPESLAKLEAAERYVAETSEAGKFLSSLTGTKEKRLLDPLEADHLIRGIFGTAGAMAQWFTNSIAVASGERAALTDKQQPITGSFLRADVGRRNEDLFYDFKAKVDKRYGTYAKMLEREDDAAAEAYEEKHSDIIDFYKDVNKIDSELKEINAEIRYYGESKDTGLTPNQRREEIKLLQLEKQELLDDVIEMRKEAGL